MIADIPGLIEGASAGAGPATTSSLHRAHALAVHVLDIAPSCRWGGSDALANHATIERELALHDERLARSRVLVLEGGPRRGGARERGAPRWRERLGEGVPVPAARAPPARTARAPGEPCGVPRRHRRTPPRPAGRADDAAPDSTGAPRRCGRAELAEHMLFRPRPARAFTCSAPERTRSRSTAGHRAPARTLRRRQRRGDVPRERLRTIGVIRAAAEEVSAGRRGADRRRQLRARPRLGWSAGRTAAPNKLSSDMRRIVVKLGSACRRGRRRSAAYPGARNHPRAAAERHREGRGRDRHQWRDRPRDAGDGAPPTPDLGAPPAGGERGRAGALPRLRRGCASAA